MTNKEWRKKIRNRLYGEQTRSEMQKCQESFDEYRIAHKTKYTAKAIAKALEQWEREEHDETI